ncbi:MAG TPA: hypothetical protein VMR14_21055 [Streptosporangiaceae bacterium]|jgi:hypothetical protein|nr:hypothetical protein [Streptosporangiaceae bacterium]
MPQPASGPAASGAAASDAAADDVAASDGASASAGTQPIDSPTSPGSVSQNGAASHNGAASQNGAGSPVPVTTQPGSGKSGGRWSAGAVLGVIVATLRRHWIASILVAGGIVMRVITQLAYHPAIVYIDTLKYLYGAWPGSDPIAYKIPLKMILKLGGDLGTVEAVQHLLGLAMAVTLYAVIVRRGGPRWLGAIAMVPVLFDGYQLQAEAMIMPDVWFEALIVAGLAVLLWNKRPTVQTLIFGAFLLGGSTGVRQVGEIMIVPALVLVIALGGGLAKMLVNATAVIIAFVLAIVLYMGASYALTKNFFISYSSSSLTYGRMAAVVDCATIKLQAPEKLLCPTKWEQAQGPDWLEHSVKGPLRELDSKLPANLVADRAKILSHFNHAVERQQPFRVAVAVLKDSVKLFAVTRKTSPGDTPIWRWQFHGYFPTYGKYIFTKYDPTLHREAIYITLPHKHAQPLASSYGGAPTVNVPLARFLRSYQLNGGYTPGPLLALFTLFGLIGSVLLLFRRRLSETGRDLSVACLTFFTGAVAVLGMSDVFEFSWRYQLPALVTLPAAGALGVAVILAAIRRRREPVAAQPASERAPELAAPAQ